MVSAVGAFEIARLKFQYLQYLSDFIRSWAQYWNDCGNENISNARCAARDGETARHLETAEQFLVTPAHEHPLAA